MKSLSILKLTVIKQFNSHWEHDSNTVVRKHLDFHSILLIKSAKSAEQFNACFKLFRIHELGELFRDYVVLRPRYSYSKVVLRYK